MNVLEKVNSVLAQDGRQIKYGAYVDETADPLITLEIGDSLAAVNYLGDGPATQYQTLSVGTVATDYIAGFDLLEQLKADLTAQNATVKLIHTADIASVYEKESNRYIFKATFKSII